MGCGSSQQTQVAENGKPVQSNKKMKSTVRVYPTSSTIVRVSSTKSTKSKEMVDSAVGSRNSSAISTSSKKTADSGLDEGSRNDNPLDIFTNRGPSGKVRTVEEAEIIENLRSEGLISRPKSVSSGMSFDITLSNEPTPLRRLPPRLQRLEGVSEVKKSLTEDDIKTKLAKAAERRKKKQAAAFRPPRPPTRSGTITEYSEPESKEVPFVRVNHPENEVLRPPTSPNGLYKDLSGETAKI